MIVPDRLSSVNIIIAVFNTDQVEDVIENHLLPALGEGSNKIVMVMSTCDPDQVAALAARVTPRGIRYLDVPVSGTSEVAIRVKVRWSCGVSSTSSCRPFHRPSRRWAFPGFALYSNDVHQDKSPALAKNTKDILAVSPPVGA